MPLFSSCSPDPTLKCAESLLDKDLIGTTVLVTGATGVFGRAISQQLAKQGASVILAVRRLDAGEKLASEINAMPNMRGSSIAWRLDLADFESIKDFATRFIAEHNALHILIENAAVAAVGTTPTAAGFEPNLGINYYGHFLLRHLLEPLLVASAPSRILAVSTALHDRMFTYEPVTLDLDADPKYLGFTTDRDIDQLKQLMGYSRSKLAIIMSATAAAPRLAKKGVIIVSLHPGFDVSTGMFRDMPKSAKMMQLMGPFLGVLTTEQSMQSVLHCSLEDIGALSPGAYYSQYHHIKYRDGQTKGFPMKSPNPLVNPQDCARLESLTYKVLGLKHPGGSGDIGEEADSAGNGA